MFVKKSYRESPKSNFGPGQRHQFQDNAEAFRKQIGTNILKQTSYEKTSEVAVSQLKEYCAHSTIHGVRYFVDKNRHWLERVWWIVGFVVSIFCCGALIHKVYDNWEEKSVIVSFAGDFTSVWNIPFPAVTICPSTKVQIEQFNLTEIYEKLKEHPTPPFNITNEELKVLIAYNTICGPINELVNVTNNISYNFVNDILRKIAPSLNYTVPQCYFPNGNFNCKLDEIMTEMGLCFTFNMLNGNETYIIEGSDYFSQIQHNKTAKWNLENGYDSNIKMNSETFPYRVSGSGAEADILTLHLDLSKKHWQKDCVDRGFTITLHIPGEIPQPFKYAFHISTSEKVHASVSPKIITTSNGLRSYRPDRRKCFFDSDRKLRFLRVYTQRNCELECLTNFTLSLCGCVQFYMTRDANTPICGPAKVECCYWAIENLVNGRIKQGFHIPEEENIRLNQLVVHCNCLPECNSISYDVEILKKDLHDHFDYVEGKADRKDDQRSILVIYFKENKFISLTRSELYGIIDFIASCGGLLGLFIGASFLSVVELVYYCSLRLYCNRCTRINPK